MENILYVNLCKFHKKISVFMELKVKYVTQNMLLTCSTPLQTAPVWISSLV